MKVKQTQTESRKLISTMCQTKREITYKTNSTQTKDEDKIIEEEIVCEQEVEKEPKG